MSQAGRVSQGQWRSSGTRRGRAFLVALVCSALLVVIGSGWAYAAYPDRPIQIIVPWGAGGGTDQVARLLASLLQEDLGVPVNVVNRAGGGGAIGHVAGASARPDGYTLTMVTVELATMHWMGLAEVDYSDFTPIGIVNVDPAGVTVAADAPWKNLAELTAAIKANPGRYRASGTATGGIWDLARVGWLTAAGLEPSALPWVPSTGAAQALQELVAGGVHVVTCSVAEAATMIRAGSVRPLAVMAEQRLPAFPDVPTLKELGVNWSLGTWRGLAAPAGTPREVVQRLEASLAKAVASDRYRAFMREAGFGVTWIPADQAALFLHDQDRTMGDLLRSMGLAK